MFFNSLKLTCKAQTKSSFKLFSSSASSILYGFDPNIPLDEAFTPPSNWYTSPVFYEKEIELVWKKNWVCIDSFLDLDQIGEFKTGNFVEQPYILIKSRDDLKAFYNVCLHHGSIIENKPSGKCDGLECPYHGWGYSLDGQLTKCTSMKGIKNFKLKENKLKQIKSFNYGNLNFLNFDEGAQIEEFKMILSHFQQAHIARKIDSFFPNLTFVKIKDYIINCNWKIYVDNWLDGGYHLPYLHKKFNKDIEMKDYTIKNYKKLNIKETPSNSDKLGDSVYSFIYPNCMIARNGPWLEVGVISPLGVDKCQVSIKWMISREKKNDQKFIEESLKSNLEIQEEDVFISELVSKGVKSDGYQRGRYVPSKESGMYYFHKQLCQDMI